MFGKSGPVFPFIFVKNLSLGDHELRISGTLAPLPGRMIWESHKVEDVIARSQEYLAMGGLN